MKLLRCLVVAGVVTFGALTPSASACPMCQEAAGSSSTGQNDASRQARAFNRAIYLMVSMPYLLLGGLGVLFYRSVQKARSSRDSSDAPVNSPSEPA